jgi:hypothetical protein
LKINLKELHKVKTRKTVVHGDKIIEVIRKHHIAQDANYGKLSKESLKTEEVVVLKRGDDWEMTIPVAKFMELEGESKTAIKKLGFDVDDLMERGILED